MSTQSAFLKNTWYVAAWSHEIGADALLARTIIRIPLLLWRDETGRVIAFEDRCCHRAAPLSKGRREGNNIRCMYHGLLFDSTGRCVEIPSQDFIPPAAQSTRLSHRRTLQVGVGVDGRSGESRRVADSRYALSR